MRRRYVAVLAALALTVSTILAKLQLGERGQAIVRAREAGLGRRD